MHYYLGCLPVKVQAMIIANENIESEIIIL